jgi:hypothetical protein
VSVTNELADLLLRGRNTDGGWGYYPGKSSRLEPTAWAVLALRRSVGSSADAVLAAWPAQDGLLLEHAGGQPNYGFHGVALLVMRALGIDHQDGVATLVAGLQRVKGVALAPAQFSRQNNALQGWSWIPETFSWVEPTAWCLLASKKWAQNAAVHVDRARVDEAERLLIDRSCLAGGWNYGNSNMLGKELKPYVPTTAVALLAMQDRPAETAVERGLKYLDASATTERSGSALALALLALEGAGHPTDAVRTALNEQLPVTSALRNHTAMAQALFALDDRDEHGAFRL